MADYVSKDMINKAMQVDLLEYAKSLGMEFETRGRNNTFYQTQQIHNYVCHFHKSYVLALTVLQFDYQYDVFLQDMQMLCVRQSLLSAVSFFLYAPVFALPEYMFASALIFEFLHRTRTLPLAEMSSRSVPSQS